MGFLVYLLWQERTTHANRQAPVQNRIRLYHRILHRTDYQEGRHAQEAAGWAVHMGRPKYPAERQRPERRAHRGHTREVQEGIRQGLANPLRPHVRHRRHGRPAQCRKAAHDAGARQEIRDIASLTKVGR